MPASDACLSPNGQVEIVPVVVAALEQASGTALPAGVDAEKVLPHMQPMLAYQRRRPLAELLDDVASVILFLASDESRSCTGGDFPVDGGNASLRRAKGAPGD